MEERMSTTVTAANRFIITSAEAPDLPYICESELFVSCKVLVSRRLQSDEGEWGNDEPTAQNVKLYGPAATSVHDSCGSGDPILSHGVVHGLERTESWADKETGEKHILDVVVVDSRFGEVGVSLSTSSCASSAPRARPRPAKARGIR